jgi:hypothetical protein
LGSNVASNSVSVHVQTLMTNIVPIPPNLLWVSDKKEELHRLHSLQLMHYLTNNNYTNINHDTYDFENTSVFISHLTYIMYSAKLTKHVRQREIAANITIQQKDM